LKYTVRFSTFAKEDKEEIKTYLSKFYPETPRRFTVSLKEHIANLKDNPYYTLNIRKIQTTAVCLSVIILSFIKLMTQKNK